MSNLEPMTFGSNTIVMKRLTIHTRPMISYNKDTLGLLQVSDTIEMTKIGLSDQKRRKTLVAYKKGEEEAKTLQG